MPIVIFLIEIAAETTSPRSSSHEPMDHFFSGDCASNKLTAATLQAARIARAVSTEHFLIGCSDPGRCDSFRN